MELLPCVWRSLPLCGDDILTGTVTTAGYKGIMAQTKQET